MKKTTTTRITSLSFSRHGEPAVPHMVRYRSTAYQVLRDGFSPWETSARAAAVRVARCSTRPARVVEWVWYEDVDTGMLVSRDRVIFSRGKVAP